VPVKVNDPFGAASDSQLPSVALALDPGEVERRFKRGLPRLATPCGTVQLKSIRVLHHKPGRRCVIEYDVRVQQPDLPRTKAILIGKVRARRFGNEAYRLLDAFWKSGFDKKSPDFISVPEPIGVIPELRVWLQRKIAGELATNVLLGPQGLQLARRTAEALCKLHRAGVPTERVHTMADELRILHEHLPCVSRLRPEWRHRIERLLEACVRLGASVPTPTACGIHRDFYPAQLMVRKGRLFLLDFDLYCQGDPALDAGNFIGHLTEMSLRLQGTSEALADREQALAERFLELNGPASRSALTAYATLTLVRHVYLSTQFPERAPFTERLLQLCEDRLLG